MHLSVIVITFNRADSLGRVLDSFKTLARPNDQELEVVVVDNNSRDGTRRVVEQRARDFPFPIRYVFEPRQGTNFARNAGIAESRGEVLAFVDDDNTIACDWLAGLQTALAAAPGASTISGPVVPVFPGVEPGAMPEWLPSRLWGYYGHQDFGPVPTVIAAPHWPHEMNIAIRRWVFGKVGVFGTAVQREGKKLISNDGFDFVNRVRASGGECAYHPAMLAYHHIPESRATPEFLVRRLYWQAVSDARGDSALAGLSTAELLRRAWKETPRLLRLSSGGYYSPRRIRWHFLKLPLSDRCSIAYRFGRLSEQVRLALSPRPWRAHRDDKRADATRCRETNRMKIVCGSFINLAHRTDKYRHISEQIRKLPIPFLRTEGVVVKSVESYPAEDYIEHGSLRHRGIVGCFLAHRNAVANLAEAAVRRGLDADDYVLVIEDDTCVDARFFDHTRHLPDWDFADMVFFDIANVDEKTPAADGNGLDRRHLIDERHRLYYVYDTFPVFMGTFCYAIKVKRLRAILDRLDRTQAYKDIDGFYYRNFRCYACITNLITVDESFYSDRHIDAEWNRKRDPDPFAPTAS